MSLKDKKKIRKNRIYLVKVNVEKKLITTGRKKWD